MSRMVAFLSRTIVLAVAALALLFVDGHSFRPVESGEARAVQRTIEEPARGFLFLSANTDEDLPLEEATRRLHSPRQKEFRELAAQLLDASARHRVRDAMGDWSDGVENSILVTVSGHASREAL